MIKRYFFGKIKEKLFKAIDREISLKYMERDVNADFIQGMYVVRSTIEQVIENECW